MHLYKYIATVAATLAYYAASQPLTPNTNTRSTERGNPRDLIAFKDAVLEGISIVHSKHPDLSLYRVFPALVDTGASANIFDFKQISLYFLDHRYPQVEQPMTFIKSNTWLDWNKSVQTPNVTEKPASWGRPIDLSKWNYDLVEADSLVKRAGYTGKIMTVELNRQGPWASVKYWFKLQHTPLICVDLETGEVMMPAAGETENMELNPSFDDKSTSVFR